jgi:hypothetical protein
VLLGLSLPLVAAGEGLPSLAPAGAVVDRWAVLDESRYSLGLVRIHTGFDPVTEPSEEEAAISGVRFHASVTEKDRGDADTGLRLLDFHAEARSPLWGGSLLGKTQAIGYGAVDPPLPVVPDPQPHAVHLDVRGTWDWLESGVGFLSVTPGLEKVTGPTVKPDREGGELWMAVALGQFRLRATVAEVSDNLLGDPSRPRTTKTDARLALELRLPSGSLASLGVSQGTSVPAPARRGPGGGRTPEARDFESLVLTLYRYGGPQWDFNLTTTYTQAQGRRRPEDEIVAVVHDLAGSYRPTPSLSITPALSVSEDDGAGGAGNRYLSTSVTVALAPPVGPLELALYGAYARGYTTDERSDTRTIDAFATLTWRLRRSAPTAALVFEVGCTRYVDAIWGSADYDDVRGQVSLRIAGF